MAQAGHVADRLCGAELVEASSDGEPGDKSRFVRGVERALLEGRADIGVHSAKDLPAVLSEGLSIAAVPAREDPADAWVGLGAALDEVPEGARVGTASLRRRAQLLATRPDLRVEELHGNVDTRLRRVAEGGFDAVVLALAGLKRLGKEGEVAFVLPTGGGVCEVDVDTERQPHKPPASHAMTPAAGQGALVLQVRVDDKAAREAVAELGDDAALVEVTAERAVVAALEADCTTPIGVLARVEGKRLAMEAFVGLPDGNEWIRDRIEGEAADPVAIGEILAERLIGAGAADILDRAGA